MPSQHTLTVLSVLTAEHYVDDKTEESRLITLSNLLKKIPNLPQPNPVHLDEDDRSFKILVQSVNLLESDSNYVRHLACAILVAVSQYLSPSFQEWEAFIRSLFAALENATSSSASCILEVLCNVFKHIKRESPSQFRKVFFVSFSPFLQKTQWDHLSKQSNFLRLLCSLLGQQGDSHGFVSSVVDNFPRIISCFHEDDVSYYTRHKLLMIMWRLTGQSAVEVSSLLPLVHRYYDDVLMEPIVNDKRIENQSLEDSPFLSSPIHLQRYAVIILLRLCFDNMKHHKNDGYNEIDKWADQQTASVENHLDFSASFVHLYLQEDDMLFSMLLQLLTMHGFITKLENGGNERVKRWFEHAFDPARLFHMFLKGVNYDHQVLVDYLISKDSGMSSAEYLLKCLRIVCDSWAVFAEFSFEESVSCKKMKGCTPLEKAGICLVSLKRSVEKLHRKRLFPYNPQPLLKRLEKFQSLLAAA